jgi:hypothetical protein
MFDQELPMVPNLVVFLVRERYGVDPLQLVREGGVEREEGGGAEEPDGVVCGVEVDDVGG